MTPEISKHQGFEVITRPRVLQEITLRFLAAAFETRI